MSTFRLREIALPGLEVPLLRPAIPAATYADRCRRAVAAAGCDWLVVYADREHVSNIVFLTGFEPRFEEALLLLHRDGRKIVVTGNESVSYVPVSPLADLEVMLAQSLSLMAQDRTIAPRLADVLAAAGIAKGNSVGLVGWKYIEPEEGEPPETAHFVPSFVVDVLRKLVGADGVRDATAVLMHPVTGVASIVDADQIAAFEWAAARASAAVWRVIENARPGAVDFEVAAAMGYAGEPMTCHFMLASAPPGTPVIGLSSPSGRRLAEGDGVTTAIGYWGGLSARAGLLKADDEGFLATSAAYMDGLAAWYGAARLGAAGGDIRTATVEALARGELRSALNPGHLGGYGEWLHSPVRPGSTEAIASGMVVQVDVIPVPMPDGWTLNCEDAIVFADAALRTEISERHPEVFARMMARRAFVEGTIGVDLDASILPLSTTPLCLAPFWLRPGNLLARG
ncbi:Xaa-Pro aminopeptidase [Methylobrevis albus]|uniref:Xaa-Pro aminopeptidase n=1 Tax=Methylobrevis albus TaxID=2793297 RepID=A0A931I5D9_9HYPH|nr:Xaa-Pro aminopeptidase [Methylobrevis albus]MBH0239894.1 Xaa-Pro aminopeptidase [Methylobrevis albus]